MSRCPPFGVVPFRMRRMVPFAVGRTTVTTWWVLSCRRIVDQEVWIPSSRKYFSMATSRW